MNNLTLKAVAAKDLQNNTNYLIRLKYCKFFHVALFLHDYMDSHLQFFLFDNDYTAGLHEIEEIYELPS